MFYIHWSRILVILCKKFSGLVLQARYGFLLNPTLNTSPKPQLLKVRPCRHPYHTWDLGLGTWNPVWSGKSHLSCSQRLRLHRLTSGELEIKTWDPLLTGPYYAQKKEEWQSPIIVKDKQQRERLHCRRQSTNLLVMSLDVWRRCSGHSWWWCYP